MANFTTSRQQSPEDQGEAQVTFSSILSSRRKPVREASLIVSRFNKQRDVRDQFSVSPGTMLGSGEKLIELRKDSENFTVVTTTAIEGAWKGQPQLEKHSLGLIKYKIVDPAGQVIETKDNLESASGVLINGKSKFWLPSHAVLPFCNLLNFIQ